ncbi:LOW QUALITY PROTEIN: hypothetical protein RJ641_000322 [Dillenia turbinata]|uniref:Uncharacterized protein n=1 Tax=Dillenia turbinata TaxID=194707 RepID=A0AAN8WBQ9_9MAGN
MDSYTEITSFYSISATWEFAIRLSSSLASYISKFEACDSVSGSERIHQSESWAEEVYLSDGLLFPLVLHFSSSLCVHLDHC